MPRFHCPIALSVGQEIALPEGAARHVQVLRLQPGMAITLFNGEGGEHSAEITHMGKREVRVRVLSHQPVEREAARAVHLVVGMPANERMDWLVEKATELGVTRITPLMTARSVLRLSGERADKKRAHWHDIAASACEQCGRNRVPVVHDAVDLAGWVRAHPQPPADPAAPLRLLLSLREGTRPLLQAAAGVGPVWFLSGPEGGLSVAEETLAVQHGFAPTTLGPRVLRAETAPLAALAALTLA